jgi:GrpB-like predicted nucleotidyltransferase (UPF0157 family)
MKHEIDEPVELVPHNPQWAEWYLEESASLKKTLGDDAKGIEHFGSTAIPNIWAKPIVDILIGVGPDILSKEKRQCLINIGYKYYGEAGVTGRLYFTKRAQRNFNLAVVSWGGPLWHANILFRDYLKCHPDESRLYEKSKKAVVKKGSLHLFEYSDRKKPIISKLMKNAEKWSSHQLPLWEGSSVK